MDAERGTAFGDGAAEQARTTRARGGVEIPQLSRGTVLAVWAAAAVPMAALAWIVAPVVARSLSGANALIEALLVGLTAGLVWQFVLVVVLVAREQRTVRRAVLLEALWLRAPRSPRTGRVGGRLWWVLLPLLVAFAAESVLATLPVPATRDLALFLGSASGEAFFHGAWGWLAVVVVTQVFNTVLGEELLFRGYLLPRMSGAFGRGDWVANGVLFAAYHLHVPWVIPGTLLDALILSYPTRRYRSAWIGIVVHSSQSVFFFAIILALVL
jgi:membrane protease YdiL (CAAX protease family)